MNWIQENIEKTPSLTPFLDHVDIIEKSVNTNPTLCVETCKALIEGICKTILTNKNVHFANGISFSALVQETISSTLNADETYRADIVDLGRRVAGVADKLGLIRNNAGFVSHGMDVLNPRLTETLSIFAYKITDTIGGFILSCYNNNRIVSADHRIHYEDCKSFNEYFDNINQLPFGLSASLALIMQDYEAYKASYFEFLSDLESEFEVLGVADGQ
jgi:hypothetical protein